MACISFLCFSLTRRSLLSHSDLLRSLPACSNNGNFLCFMKKILNDLPGLFCSFIPEDSFLRVLYCIFLNN